MWNRHKLNYQLHIYFQHSTALRFKSYSLLMLIFSNDYYIKQKPHAFDLPSAYSTLCALYTGGSWGTL